MTELPPEILAIPLPDGYTWGIYANDPCVREVGSEVAIGWVNYDGVPTAEENSCAVYVAGTGQHYSYKDHKPPLTMVNLCRILANHVWVGV